MRDQNQLIRFRAKAGISGTFGITVFRNSQRLVCWHGLRCKRHAIAAPRCFKVPATATSLAQERAEQRAIATTLSDVDALLDALDRLIAKKRDLKQAAMQQLLTGQTRLPGFHGEWEVKTLGDLGSSSADGQASSTSGLW